MPDRLSGTVTFLFTDIEGSTSLLRQLGRTAYGELLAQQQQLLRDAFAAHEGEELDTQGDSFFVAFRSAADAVAAAVTLQRSLAAHRWLADAEVHVRVGIHTGEATVTDERYLGLAVHRASRIGAAGHGGQVLLSETTRGLLADEELEGVELRDLGEHRLKDLDRPERLYQLEIDELRHDFPPLRTDEVARVAGDVKRELLDFRILGPLEVMKDGRPLALGGQKQRALLALLLLDAGRVVSVDRIVDALWGERPPRTAPTSLQNFVSHLRKVLGANVLVTQPPGYLLRIGREQLDLECFLALVDAARQLAGQERAAKLRQALTLWRGPPLADFAFDAFAQSEIGRLEELRLGILEERIEAEIEAGAHAELVGELEVLVEEHPLREGLRRHLMLALYRSGRQAEALQVYHDARRVLVDELGIDPSRSLQQLHGSILRQDAELEVGGAAPAAQDRLQDLADAMLGGRLVPVLGTDLAELSAHLAERFEYPLSDRAALPRIAQYVAVMRGSGPLYDELHAVLSRQDLPPTQVHRFLAALPPLLRERNVPHQLIVSTSYDLALERAFLEAGEEFDVVAYLAAGRNRGKFCHVRPDGTGTLIDLPNEYATELSLERRTIILKLHGQVDPRLERAWESFVVTEDDYIDYLAQTEVGNVVPVALAAKLRRSHFLFLGYTMADWNLRLLLNRLWGDQPLSYRSWAVQAEAKPLEREFWRRRDVDVLEIPFERCVATLAQYAGIDLPEAQT
jgi:DNA-binding SARP family transcriptional activator/class 3 adenylate cyclase